MTVAAFPRSPRPHVVIDSGWITGGDSPELVGRWCYMVDFVDADGSILHDYIGPDYAAAGEAAIAWARDFGCRIDDRSIEEPAQ